jgi:hypothetical protein
MSLPGLPLEQLPQVHPIVLPVHDHGRNVDLLEIFREVGLGECLDTKIRGGKNIWSSKASALSGQPWLKTTGAIESNACAITFKRAESRKT